MLHPLFLLMQLCIATWINVKKTAFKKYGMDFVFFEFVLDTGATIYMSLLFFSLRRSSIRYVNRSNLPWIIVSGLVSVTMTQLFFCFGLQRLPPSYTATWMIITPVLVTVGALVLKYEEFKRMKLVGIIVTISGCVLLVVFKAITTRGNSYFYGDIFMVASAICNASGILIQRKLLKEMKLPPSLVATGTLISGQLFMTVALVTKPIWGETEYAVNYTSLLALEHLVAITFVISMAYAAHFGIMAWCTSKSSISIVAIYASARPFFTCIISFILDVTIDPWTSTLGMGFVVICFTGLIIGSISKKQEKSQKINQQVSEIRERLESTVDFSASRLKLEHSYAPAYLKMKD
jgi:drug/metabolite transporter (DMT)-like permease